LGLEVDPSIHEVRRKKELAAYWLPKKRGRDPVFSSHPRRRLPCSRFSVRGDSCYLPFSAGAMPLEHWLGHTPRKLHLRFAVAALKPYEWVVGVVGDLESSVLAEGAA
jgi:hypothetical protein